MVQDDDDDDDDDIEIHVDGEKDVLSVTGYQIMIIIHDHDDHHNDHHHP